MKSKYFRQMVGVREEISLEYALLSGMLAGTADNKGNVITLSFSLQRTIFIWLL